MTFDGNDSWKKHKIDEKLTKFFLARYDKMMFAKKQGKRIFS